MITVTVPIKTVGIRRAPSVTPINEEIIGVLHKDDKVDVSTKRKYYDWMGKSFYRCASAIGDGYIRSDLIDSILSQGG